jgi:sigma-B regulation protein RsbU (phosphoserine phosphatase)
MANKLSMTNESFNFLRSSTEFLNIVLNNISCCVLLLDRDMKLHAFNNALKTIFTSRKDEDLLYVKCGEAIGCAHQIEEVKRCGETTQCCHCELRIAALNSYMNNKVIYNDHITRPFFTHEGNKINKHLKFSTRLFLFDREKYILMLVEDISELVILSRTK